MQQEARATRTTRLLAALALSGIACLPAAAATHTMNAMPDFTFNPSTLTINQGDTVVFSNEGGFHNVVGTGAADFRCASGCDGEGGDGNASGASWTFSRVFDNAGTVNIACQVHAAGGMRATITVLGGGGGNAGQIRLTSGAISRSENGGNFTVGIERTDGDDGIVSVDYATSNGSASAGNDYNATSGTLTWNSGEDGVKNISVAILDDGADEDDETLNFSLSNPTGGAALGSPGNATLTIVDDESATPQPGNLGFAAATYNAAENGNNATVTVNRTGGSNGAVAVTYSTSDGTGVAGTDYTATTGVLSWGDGDGSSKTFQVHLLDDAALDGTKTVNLQLSNPTGGAGLGTANAVLSIADNEQPACVPGPKVLCLGENNRFEVKVHWMDFVGQMDDADSVTIGKRDSGLFYFFDQNNIEMLIKVLDGCHINSKFWVFYAATTNVAFHVQVRDTRTGFSKGYDNSLGNAAPPVLDIEFENCQ